MALQIQFQFSDAGLGSAFAAGLTYTAVRTLARVVTAVVPTSALLALLGALIWLAAALWLFFVVTWQRDDSWLAAGAIMGASLLCGGLAADFLSSGFDTGSISQAVLSTGAASLGLLFRAALLVPLAGGFVFGARWLTTELRGDGALS